MAAGVIVAALTGPPAHAVSSGPSVPPTGQVTLELVGAYGSGCGQGLSVQEVALDNSLIHLICADYMVWIGPGSRPTDFRKNCQLFLRVHMPPGFTFSIPSVEHGGYAELAAGATATFRESVRRAGDPMPPWISHTFTGPIADDWYLVDPWPSELTSFPCGSPATINLNTELRLFAGTSDPKTTTSFVTTDGLDPSGARFGSTLRLDWATC